MQGIAALMHVYETRLGAYAWRTSYEVIKLDGRSNLPSHLSQIRTGTGTYSVRPVPVKIEDTSLKEITSLK